MIPAEKAATPQYMSLAEELRFLALEGERARLEAEEGSKVEESLPTRVRILDLWPHGAGILRLDPGVPSRSSALR